jgi:cytoskeletal protein CcmA (bactofilin family)
VNGSSRVLVVGADTALKGKVRNGGRIEILGYIEGEIVGDQLIVHPGGRCYGRVKVDTAEVHGIVQGDIAVKELISIRSTGSVSGNVRYGRLAMEMGADLTAQVRNVPPSISGDLDLTVSRGQSVRITLQDLAALDPDDEAKHLTFTVSQAKHGFITLSSDPARPVMNFTQADLDEGSVLFRHDGTDTPHASFDVTVVDRARATSGAPQTVKVSVRP